MSSESSGLVADSMDVRRALIDRMHKGEITLAEAQAISEQELQRLRNQAWADVAAIEARDPRYHRALVDQVQHNAYMGVWS